jgi:hypothetical protein
MRKSPNQVDNNRKMIENPSLSSSLITGINQHSTKGKRHTISDMPDSLTKCNKNKTWKVVNSHLRLLRFGDKKWTKR